jgi:hypothetical protein
VDESFFEFWGFRRPDGNFCYVVFGLPVEQLAILEARHGDLLDDFKKAFVSELKEPEPIELKSSSFRRLGPRMRRRFGLRLRDLIEEIHGFIIAEYSEVRGFVLESIRSDLLDQAATDLPQNYDELYMARTKELSDLIRQEKAGQSPTLRKLIELPTSALAFYLVPKTNSYEVLLDPRGSTEDANIAKMLRETTLEVINNVQRDNPAKLKQVRFDIPSEKAPGLQVADILAGEIRQWFLSNPELLTFSSSRRLLRDSELPQARGRNQYGEIVVKPQRTVALPPGLERKLSRATPESALPYFRDSLANGLLSCLAYYGEFRHIDFANHQIIDSPDNKSGPLEIRR